MKESFSKINKLILLSIVFTLLLLTIRIIYTSKLYYLFYAWNLFLAIIPLVISNYLCHQKKLNVYTFIWILIWLLFLPNAPYLITDIFHFKERVPVPVWFDLMLVTSAAWNGLIAGIISILQVERFLKQVLPATFINVITFIFIILTAFGVYLGRYLRFNSWEIVTQPVSIFKAIGLRFVYPFNHLHTWAFTCLFAVMLYLIYQTIKQLNNRTMIAKD